MKRSIIQDDFAADASRVRDYISDSASYKKIFELYENKRENTPLFVFNVTMQNHGGYDVGGLSDELAVSVPLGDGSRSSELDEYASVIRQADRDLAYLVDRLNALDRPVVLCFFGDHQPGFSDWLFEATHDGAAADDLGLEAVQERYTVPYLIWANDAARAQGAHEPQGVAHERTSLNYRGVEARRGRRPAHDELSALPAGHARSRPAINLNGFLTATAFGTDSATRTRQACSTRCKRTQPSSTTTSSTRTRPGR